MSVPGNPSHPPHHRHSRSGTPSGPRRYHHIFHPLLPRHLADALQPAQYLRVTGTLTLLMVALFAAVLIAIPPLSNTTPLPLPRAPFHPRERGGEQREGSRNESARGLHDSHGSAPGAPRSG